MNTIDGLRRDAKHNMPSHVNNLEEQRIIISYIDRHGVLGSYVVIPKRISFGYTETYKQPQWFLEAQDVNTQVTHHIRMSSVVMWRPE